MLKRWCHLALEAKASSTPLEWVLLYMLPDDRTKLVPLASAPCQQVVYTLDTLSLSLLAGRTLDRWKLHSFNALVEFAFFTAHNDLHSVDHLWVFEQDVAWQGNLFDILGNFRTWEDDYLCMSPGEWHITKPSEWLAGPMNAGFADEKPATYGNTTFVKVTQTYLPRTVTRICA
jgi:hypothetical protein